MIGGADVATFKEEGRRYDIRMRLPAEERADLASVSGLFVPSRAGELVQLRNVVSSESGAAASAITRTNRQRSVQVTANLVGVPLGDGVAIARGLAAEMLPDGVRMTVAGEARELEEGGRDFLVVIGLSILMIYMVLAAQFESLSHPLVVMLALPLSMLGALGGLLLSGNTLNLFSAIGILLLFGLVGKNAILLVDYANQLRARGIDKVSAIREAAPVRMRPVLMTALSMVFGVLPAALGFGPGAETRAPMAIATAAGMVSSTVLTLLVVPVFYLIVDDAAESFGRRFRRVMQTTRTGAMEPRRTS
jgi:HAE1 family hydrophobic/amphiphilic exporter-1